MAIAVVFAHVTLIQNAWLNAYHRVSILARIAVLNTLFGALVAMAIVWQGGTDSIPIAVVAAAGVSPLVSRYFYRSSLPADFSRPTWSEVVACGRALINFGIPYTGSSLISTGSQIALPIVIVHVLGQTEVGYFRAATTISVTYLGFLTLSLAQDFYPRLSAVRDEPQALVTLANQQLRVVLIVSTPIVLVMLALIRFLVPLVYTGSFAPTVQVLDWQLVGEPLRFASLTIAYVILAATGSRTYFVNQAASGLSLLVATWLLAIWFDLHGVGISFLLNGAISCAVAYLILRHKIGFRVSGDNKQLLVAAIATVATVKVLRSTTPEILALPASLGIAGAFALYSLRAILKESDGIPVLGMLRRRAAV
jgi:PST family polysaccharide transporter